MASDANANPQTFSSTGAQDNPDSSLPIATAPSSDPNDNPKISSGSSVGSTEDNPNSSSAKDSVPGFGTEENPKPSSAHKGKASHACSDEELMERDKGKKRMASSSSKRSRQGELDAVVPSTTPVGEQILARNCYHFQPSDEDLIVKFLAMMIGGNELDDHIIQEVDLYSYDADELSIKKFRHCPGRMAYYFVDLKEEINEYLIRPTRSGYWTTTETDKKIYKRSLVVGFMKTLVFYKGTPPYGRETPWVMHEYNLNPKAIPPDVYHGDVRDRTQRIRVCLVKHKMESHYVSPIPRISYRVDEDAFSGRHAGRG